VTSLIYSDNKTTTAAATNTTQLVPESEFRRYPFFKHCHYVDHCPMKYVYLANFLMAFVLPFVAILVLYHFLIEALLESAIGPHEVSIYQY
jgi:hypothetical protein